MKGTALTIVFAVAVIGIVGVFAYNSYFKGSTTPTSSAATICQDKLSSYCTVWKANAYGRNATEENSRPGPWETYATGCSRLNVTPTVDGCTRLLGTTSPTGRIARR